VCLLEIPFGLSTSLVWQIFLQEIKQVDSHLLQGWQLTFRNFRITGRHIPIHARDQNFLNLGTRMCIMG
jgi:hypothetical protein